MSVGDFVWMVVGSIVSILDAAFGDESSWTSTTSSI